MSNFGATDAKKDESGTPRNLDGSPDQRTAEGIIAAKNEGTRGATFGGQVKEAERNPDTGIPEKSDGTVDYRTTEGRATHAQDIRDGKAV